MTDARQSKEAVKVFYSYAHEDADLRDRLDQHFSFLKREKKIAAWYDGEIRAGEEWRGKIESHLETADVILLLVSAAFADSDFCYSTEMGRAMERHDAGAAVVVPILLHPCDWHTAPFAKLQALPGGKAISLWPNVEQALYEVAKGVREVVEELIANRPAGAQPEAADETVVPAAVKPQAVSSLIPRPPVVGFVARRDKEGRDIVGLLRDELAPDRKQLVALWGPGGSGKTTLAAEVIGATKDSFKGRVVWASSLNRSDFNLATLLDEVATQLGREDLRRLAPEPKAAQVAALVSEAPTLVILDNFETVPEEGQVRCLDFLARSAACPVLVTTRGFVDRDDVTNVELSAMETDEAREFLRRLIARTPKKQNFKNLDQDELIGKCEANPLLLQWVVRQIVLSKTPQTALDYLSKGEGDAAECVFTRSFDLPQLGDDGRAALLALSLFTPSASRDALAEVSGFGDDLRRLNKAVESLSSLWLIETTEGNERLFLRGLTRELAKVRLAKDARGDEFRHRYVSYFLNHAETHAQEKPEALNTLEAEKSNLLGAVDVAAGLKDWESVMQIRKDIDNFLLLRGHWDDAISSAKQAEAAAREAGDEIEVVNFIGITAIIHRVREEYEEAERIYKDMLEIFRKTGHEKNISVCLHQLGVIAQQKGELEKAERFYDESREIKERLGDRSGLSKTLNELARLAHAQGNLEEARRCCLESLEINRQLGDYRFMSITLHLLAILAVEEENVGEARRLYNESLEIAEEFGDMSNLALIYLNFGRLEEADGNKTEAVRLLREAARIFEKLGSSLAKKAREALTNIEKSPVE